MMPLMKNESPEKNLGFFEENVESEEVIEDFKCLLEKYQELKKNEKAIDIFFCDATSKTIRITNELTKELENRVNKIELLEAKNVQFEIEIDRLKAMLKVRCGKFTEYQKSVSELNDLAMELTKETGGLKNTFDENELNKSTNFSQSSKKISTLDKLMKKVSDKLNSDYEALIAAGSPDFSDYLKQISDLETFSRSLQGELCRIKTAFRLKADFKNDDTTIILQETAHLEELIDRVKTEIEKLRAAPLQIGCRIGGENCGKYLEEVLILVEIVEKSKVSLIELKSNIGTSETICKRKISELESFSKRLQLEIKELEMVVASGDNSSLIKRIKELEDSIFRLKKELVGKEDSASSLQQELTGAKIAFRQKVRELEASNSKIRALADEVKLTKQEAEEKDQQIMKLLNQLKTLKSSEIVVCQRFHTQMNSIKPALQGIRASKDNVLKEIKVIRNFLSEGISEIYKLLDEKGKVEQLLKIKLEKFSEENAQLKSNMQLLEKKEALEIDKQDKECGNSSSINIIDEVEEEDQNLKVLLEKATDEANRVKCMLEDLKNEKKDEADKLNQQISELLIIRDKLKLDLDVEKTTTKETLKTFEKLSTKQEELKKGIKILKDENESLLKSCKNAIEECSVYRNQLESLRKEAFNQHNYVTTLKTQMSFLKQEIASTRIELQAADMKNTSFEKDLKLNAIRIEDLVKENDDLRSGLNKAEIERQKLAEELNKLKEENWQHETHLKSRTDELNEMKSQNTRLQKEYESENIEGKRAIELLEKQNSVPQNESQHSESKLFKLREKNIQLEKAKFELEMIKENLECDVDKLNQEIEFLKARIQKYEIELEEQTSPKQSLETEITKDEKLEERKKFESRNEIPGEMTDFQKRYLEIQIELQTRIREIELKEETFQSLETELSKTREENESLRSQLENYKKNILSLKEKEYKLKMENEEISSKSCMQEDINLQLRKKLQESLKENDKVEAAKAKLYDLDPKLKEFFKDYNNTKKMFHLSVEEIQNLKREKKELLKILGIKENMINTCRSGNETSTIL